MRLAAPLSFVALLTACGGPPSAAQTVLSVTSHGVVEADNQLDQRLAVAGEECLAAASSRVEFEACVAPFGTAIRVLRTTVHALLASQQAFDAWNDGTDDGALWYDSIPCLLSALVELRIALEAAGVPVPALVSQAVDMASSFGGLCGGDL